MQRTWLILGVWIVAACGGGEPTAVGPAACPSLAPTVSATSSATAAMPAPVAAPAHRECPNLVRGERPLGVASYPTAAQALATMKPIPYDDPAHPPPAPDLAALGAANHGAFFLTVPHGTRHESVTTVDWVHGVFVEPKRVTVLPRLQEVVRAIPGRTKCPPPEVHFGAIAIALRPHGIGQVRITRLAESDDALTAPPPRAVAAGTPSCSGTTRMRVEDHFVDLERGEHLGALAQVYDAPTYEAATADLYTEADFEPTGGGVETKDRKCSFFWNE